MTQKISMKNGFFALVDDCDFHWLSQRNWYRNVRGYVTCDLWGRRGGMKVLMHRLILLAPDTSTVDHINHDTLDNRRINLRLATQSQQNQNRVKTFGTSKYKGVHRRCDGLKWVAQIKLPDKRLHLGSFNEEDDAARAYDEAAAAHFGEFSHLNFPEIRSNAK